MLQKTFMNTTKGQIKTIQKGRPTPKQQLIQSFQITLPAYENILLIREGWYSLIHPAYMNN